MLVRVSGYLVFGSIWLYALFHLWLAATQGVVPAFRRFGYNLVSFESAGLTGVISLLILLGAAIACPAFIWSGWHTDRHMRNYLAHTKPPIDTTIRRQLDDS